MDYVIVLLNKTKGKVYLKFELIARVRDRLGVQAITCSAKVYGSLRLKHLMSETKNMTSKAKDWPS